MECDGFWQAPELAVTNLSAGLGGGRLDATARLNVATREFTFTNSSCFDLHAIAALLTEKTRERLADFSWTQPPSLSGRRFADFARVDESPAGLARRSATDHSVEAANWPSPTAWSMACTIDSARTHFSYSNLVWRLPDLAVVKSKSRLEIERRRGRRDERLSLAHPRRVGPGNRPAVFDGEQRGARF